MSDRPLSLHNGSEPIFSFQRAWWLCTTFFLQCYSNSTLRPLPSRPNRYHTSRQRKPVSPSAINDLLSPDRIPDNGLCTVRIWQANIGKTIAAHVPITDGRVQETEHIDDCTQIKARVRTCVKLFLHGCAAKPRTP